MLTHYTHLKYYKQIIFLEYVDDKGANLELPSDSALLFCYFNNLEFFNNYIKNYKGKCHMAS